MRVLAIVICAVGRWASALTLDPVRVFSPGDAGISCFRIPAIVRTGNGTLLAFAEARHGSCSDSAVHEIALRRSVDHGRTWSEVAFPAGGAKHIVGNPYPIAMESGRILLVFVNYGRKPVLVGSGNGMVFSDDQGLSWSNETDISSGFGPAKGSLPGPGAGVEIRSPKPRLLVVSHHGAYMQDYITYSDDGGHTWATINRTFPKMDEATLADLGNGEVLLNMRHTAEPTKGRAVARSTDGGLTWSDVMFDPTLIGPVCQGSLAAFNGSVYFSNPASAHGRTDMTVRRSDDGGQTWKSQLLFQANKSAGYSSLVQGTVGDDTHGGILYESASEGAIDFVSFPLSLETAIVIV